MWSHEDFIDIFRGTVPYYLVIALPLLIIMSPVPASAAVEFSVFRLQQFELHGTVYGSQSSLVNVEARTLDAASLARRCVLARIKDLSPAIYQKIISEGAAALLVLLPSSFVALSEDQYKVIWNLEEAMIETEVQFAVYFAYETFELTKVYESVRTSTNSDGAGSAAAAMVSSFSSDGYQMVVSGSQSKKVSDSSIANIQGRLIGYGVEEQLPTVAIVAHYDAFGAAPELSLGADSNGSGVVALLEIARILSKLYSSTRTHPRMNILFLLSGGGYINYQGSKRFLEDQLDATDSPLLSEPHFALCLDTLANGNTLHLHVSKKPREDAPGHWFFTSIERAGALMGVPVEMVHRKINLQEDQQSWEHEKYSLRRLPAFTLSRLPSPNTGERGSILDTFSSLDKKALSKHTSVVLLALLQHIYNTSSNDILHSGLSVTEESISSWISLLSAQPRSPQLLSGKNNALVSSLQQVLSRYATEVKVTHYKADRRDPEWTFYDMTKSTLVAYAVKPASFDLVLTSVIAAHLGLVYAFLQYFPKIYQIMVKISSPQHKLKGY